MNSSRENKRTETSVEALSIQLGKLPPQAVEVEEVVLGALMLERDALVSVIDLLSPKTFYKDSHQEIYQAILDLYINSEPIDLLTVTAKLRKKDKLEMTGGAYYITQLTSKVNSAANIDFHARVILEAAMKRDLIQLSAMVQKEAYDDTVDVFDLLEEVEKGLFATQAPTVKRNFSSVGDAMFRRVKELEKISTTANGLIGIPSGFTSLDRVTGGWHNGDLVIIAARPSMGKTAMVVSLIRNAAVDFNIPCAIFSLEMSEGQLMDRLLSSESMIPLGTIRKGFKDEPKLLEHVISKTGRIQKAPIFIDDSPEMSILDIRAKARRMAQKHGIKLIVVDYLQLMRGHRKSNGNREQEIAEISRGLKALAKELSIPVIALSQLSRAVESRGGDKRPQLSDLRESGAIEQDADMVGFLYRPEYYGITQDASGTPTKGIGEIIIAKNRQGALDTIVLKFIGMYTKWCDINEEIGTPGYIDPPDVPSIHALPEARLPYSDNDDLPF